MAFVVRAVVRGVADFPQVNARFDDEAGVLTLHDAVHLGVATQTDGGLMVPVLRQAQTLDLWPCAVAIARLAASERAGKAVRKELSGSTLTVTSLGKLGGIVSTPVINHPESIGATLNALLPRLYLPSPGDCGPFDAIRCLARGRTNHENPGLPRPLRSGEDRV